MREYKMKRTAYRMARWAYQPIKEAKKLAIDLRAAVSRKPVIAGYLSAPGFKGLQIGSGPHKRPGWLNSDLPGESGIDIGMDITERLPFPDDSLHAIYGSEVIEHISKASAIPFLREAHRVLKINGTFRLTTPDLIEICRITLGQNERCSIEQLATVWVENKNLTRDIWANEMFRSWGHQYIWDFNSLREAILSAGFSKVERLPPQITNSGFPELAHQETRYGMPPPAFMWEMSIILEATK
jgi:predicted SAM-dependent methyltransferase